jgi:hypothetical protein
MILSEYGSRWQDPLPLPPTLPFTHYDDLRTTVGYNYVTLGGQNAWLLPGPFTFVGNISGLGGVTSDWLTEFGQDGLHSYMRYPHVHRGTVEGLGGMWGAEIEASLWYSGYWTPVSLDLMVDFGASEGSHHGQGRVGAGFGMNWWLLRIQGSALKSLWVKTSVEPTLVANQLKSDFWMASGLIALDRNAYRALSNVVPGVGAGVTYSSGLFPGEPELLISAFLEFPAGSNNSVRLEHVNDVIKDKDRGPTGGLRVTYVVR